MNDIVTTNEFCERFRIPEKLRVFYGWNTNTRRLDESTFRAKVQEIKEHKVSDTQSQSVRKRPISAVPVSMYPFAFLGRKKPLLENNNNSPLFRREFPGELPINNLPASRASIISAGPDVSKGSILDTDDIEPDPQNRTLPASRCSILQSDFTQTSILDSDIHMTTQSSPPPVILSSTCD